MKNKKLEVLSIAALFATSINANAFNNGDIISFDPGVMGCLYPPYICETFPGFEVVTKGSYYALDLDGNGSFQENERVPLFQGPDGGIVLGMLQPGPGIDLPWEFFGQLGMHQTTVTPVTQNPDGSIMYPGIQRQENG